MLGLPGEEELVGNGISFCAVCDGAFYKDRTVAMAGGGNSALQEVLLLAENCKEVIVVQNLDFFTGEKRLVEAMQARPNVRTILGTVIDGYLQDENGLTGLKLRDTHTGETSDLPVDGLFVAVGLEPKNNAAFRDVAPLNEQGYFAADETCLTGRDGIYVAGDCRSKSIRQLTTACADGAVAALAACRYLDLL